MKPNWKIALETALWWISLVIIYLLFVGTLEPSEFLAAVVAGSVPGFLGRFAWDKGGRRYLPRLRWLVPLWKVPWAVVWETLQLTGALVGNILWGKRYGLFLEHGIALPGETPASAWVTFATMGVCVTPNSYLVDADLDHGRVLIRQLVGKSLSSVDRNFLELK